MANEMGFNPILPRVGLHHRLPTPPSGSGYRDFWATCLRLNAVTGWGQVNVSRGADSQRPGPFVVRPPRRHRGYCGSTLRGGLDSNCVFGAAATFFLSSFFLQAGPGPPVAYSPPLWESGSAQATMLLHAAGTLLAATRAACRNVLLADLGGVEITFPPRLIAHRGARTSLTSKPTATPRRFSRPVSSLAP